MGFEGRVGRVIDYVRERKTGRRLAIAAGSGLLAVTSPGCSDGPKPAPQASVREFADPAANEMRKLAEEVLRVGNEEKNEMREEFQEKGMVDAKMGVCSLFMSNDGKLIAIVNPLYIQRHQNGHDISGFVSPVRTTSKPDEIGFEPNVLRYTPLDANGLPQEDLTKDTGLGVYSLDGTRQKSHFGDVRKVNAEPRIKGDNEYLVTPEGALLAFKVEFVLRRAIGPAELADACRQAAALATTVAALP